MIYIFKFRSFMVLPLPLFLWGKPSKDERENKSKMERIDLLIRGLYMHQFSTTWMVYSYRDRHEFFLNLLKECTKITCWEIRKKKSEDEYKNTGYSKNSAQHLQPLIQFAFGPNRASTGLLQVIDVSQRHFPVIPRIIIFLHRCQISYHKFRITHRENAMLW